MNLLLVGLLDLMLVRVVLGRQVLRSMLLVVVALRRQDLSSLLLLLGKDLLVLGLLQVMWDLGLGISPVKTILMVRLLDVSLWGVILWRSLHQSSLRVAL
jgi:hypothetical protein